MLRLSGCLVGWDAERVLREEIVDAAARDVQLVVDVSDVSSIDAGCLAAIEAGVGGSIHLEGGRAYLAALWRK